MKSSFSSAIVLLFLTAGVCQAALEFSGYMQTAQGTKFVMTASEEAQSSGWLVMGESFRGYTLVAFDRKKEVLSVRNSDTTIDLPLKLARVKEEKSSASDLALQLATTKEALAVMRKRYRDAHPDVQRLVRKISDLERQQAK